MQRIIPIVILSGSTVLSGAEERFAEERPGWNFSKNKNDPGLENWVQN